MEETITNKYITIVNSIDTEKCFVKLRSDGILQFDVKNVDEITAEDIKTIDKAAEEIASGKKYPQLVMFKYFLNINSEAREYASTKESNKTNKASAFVVNNIALKLVGNVYIAFNKPVVPTRLFDTEEKAVEWLNTFL